MEENSAGDRNQQTLAKHRNINGNGKRKIGPDKVDEEECDADVWNTLSNNFNEVQFFLDQNNLLIRQVNENQQSKIPDNLTKNVNLIREINSNISKVVSLYSGISVDFSSMIHQRRRTSEISTTVGDNKDCEVPGKLSNRD